MKAIRQRGTVLIEFALSFLIFWIIFVGIVEFGRTMLAWNAASEATRIAARVASICTSQSTLQKTAIANKVVYLLQLTGQAYYADPGVPGSESDLTAQPDWLRLEYFPPACNDSNCEQVQASLSGVNLKLRFPGWTLDLALPANRTTVMRESMRNPFPSGFNAVNTYCN
ncbi:MAG: TadE/TadG family type IV pilus assembly protein [Limnohabitans sp.]